MTPNISTFALSVAEKVFATPWVWFTQLLASTGLTGVFLAALSMFLAFKFLIAPFIGSTGSGSSDTAKKRKPKKDD